jgi:transposase-like protein
MIAGKLGVLGLLSWCHRRARYGYKTSQEVRTAQAAERAMEIKAYKAANPKASVREIAQVLGFGRAMVHRTLKN